jgi:PAS domain S-box-containing protein
MPHSDPEPSDADLHSEPFWTLFTSSRIPMALVDDDRRYVDANAAAIALFGYPRETVLGRTAGRNVAKDPEAVDADWQQLKRDRELYGERILTHAGGTNIRVSFAAHATTLSNRWLALFVTLSASVQPDGPELIGPARVESPAAPGLKLTPREREVVRLVALGADTRGIAAELSLSPETVRTHVRNAMTKTGAHTRAHLVALLLADRMLEGD